MTRKIAEKIVKGITDKIECNTADIDDWAEFWGFTREDYEEFLEMAIKALEQEPKTGKWIEHFDESGKWYECDQCHTDWGGAVNFCPNCGAKMEDKE